MSSTPSSLPSAVPVGFEGAADSVLAWTGSAVPGRVLLDERIRSNASWSASVPAGAVLTLVDVGGNQSADFLVFDAADQAHRYSASETLTAQGNAYLRQGSVLLSNESAPLMTLVVSEIERHDTIGGACSKESNTLRYGHHVSYQHACRENFLSEAAQHGMDARDLVSNINWFMNVPVDADGSLGIVDGMSAPGKRVALRAERDVLVIVSNCPQMNNPCNDFNPTPLQAVIVEPDTTDR